jgi:hypothetical protein
LLTGSGSGSGHSISRSADTMSTSGRSIPKYRYVRLREMRMQSALNGSSTTPKQSAL